jgi:hypothetical protein
MNFCPQFSKKRGALSPILFNSIRKIQEITEGINGTHKLLLSADDNNLMAGNINTTKKNS